MQGRTLAALTIAALATLGAATPAQAALIPVTTTADTGPDSLRAALTTANGTLADDVIDMQVQGDILLTSTSLPPVSSTATGGRLTIQGPGASSLSVRRSYAALSSVLSTNNGSDATFTGFTIENGGASGISMFGTLKLERMQISGNTTPNQGGAIYVDTNEHLTVDRSTITENVSTNAAVAGGAIYANTGAVLTITRSTIHSNESTADSSGGGIITFGAASTITGSTIAGNTVAAGATTDGANIYSQNGPVTIRDTIIADPLSSTATAAANCRSFGAGTPIVSQGYNLADDTSCSFGTPTDRPVADPGFLPLTDVAPGVLPVPPSSPAADKIPAAACATATDQRGIARPQGGACDIGAFENEVVPPLAFSNPTPIAILDSATPPTAAATYPSAINVSGLPRPVTDVTVRLHGFSHKFAADVSALLVGPQGQTTHLMSSPGDGRDAVSTTLTLNDVGSPIPGAGAIPTGTYQPTPVIATAFPAPAPAGPFGATLGVFDGTLADGAWRLFVADVADGDTGTFAGGWSLGIDTQPAPVVPAPAKKCKKRKKKKGKAGAAAKKCRKKKKPKK